MKQFGLFFSLALLVFGSGCSYAEHRALETTVEKSVEKFHTQLNEEQYQAIYAEADAELRNRISEQDFTKRLAEARARAGRTEGKANVLLVSSVGRQLRKLLSGRMTVSHVENTKCEAGAVLERFQWSVADGTARLQDYEFRQILERGKIYKLGNSNFAIGPVK
jgi:broad specificity phosphatase PhoE